MAANVPAPSPPLASNSHTIEEYFKQRTERISLDEVVVLNTPDPTSVVPGSCQYLNVDHIKWIIKNVLTDCTKYTKEELTGTRIFWVSDPENTIKCPPFVIPL